MKYFAFGSNMNPNRLKTRIGYLPDSEGAKLFDWELCFDKKADNPDMGGYANLKISKGKSVYGVLYTITEKDLLILDEFESVAKNHYYREHIKVINNNANIELAVTYLACPFRIVEGLLPAKSYLKHLIAGKQYLPAAYLKYLQALPTMQ